MKIDVIKVLPKDWLIKDLGEKIEVTYHGKRGNYNRKPFIFLKQIKIDSGFMEGFGLFLGDSDLNRKEKAHLTYTSIDKDIAKHALKFLQKYFCLDLKDTTFSVNYKTFNINLRKEWSSYLDIKNHKILTRQSDRHKNEALSIQVNGVVFRKVFEIIIKDVLSRDILKNKELRRSLLRGLFAAEGNVGIYYKENYIVQISFSLNSNENYLIGLIQKVLDLEGIKNSLYKNEEHNNTKVAILNWNNYWKLWQMNLFDICERKKQSILGIIKNLDVYLKLNDKFRDNLFDSLNMEQKEIAKIILSWQSNVSRTIKGKHLLRVEQFLSLLNYSKYNTKDVIKNTDLIRIGSLTEFKPDYEMLNYFFKIKNN